MASFDVFTKKGDKFLKTECSDSEICNFLFFISKEIISKQSNIMIPITCNFDGDFILDQSLTVTNHNFKANAGSATSNYEFELNVFETSSFESRRPNVGFNIGEEIFFQISSVAEISAPNMRYQVTSCGLKQGNFQYF